MNSSQHVGKHRTPPARSARTVGWVGLGGAVVVIAVVAVLVAGGQSGSPSHALRAAMTGSTGTGPGFVGPTGAVGSASTAPTASAQLPAGRSAVAGSAPAGSAPDCPSATVRIAVTPELASVVRAVLRTSTCPVQVVDDDPAAFVAGGAAAAHGFDAWVPDSSLWAGPAMAAGIDTTPAVPSIATSPVVYAVAPGTGSAAAQPQPADLLPGTEGAAALRVAVPDPSRSARSVAGLLAIRASVPTAAADTALTYAVHSSPTGVPLTGPDLLQYAATHPQVAVPVTEQDITAFRATHPTSRMAEVPPPGGRYRLDYPLLSLTGSSGQASALNRVAAALSTAAARAALARNGFDVDRSAAVTAQVPSRAQAADVIADVELLAKPAKTLALIDISGSMAQQVPGGGGQTRLDYARAAAVQGLQQFSPSSQIGLWVFSRDLLPGGQDYRQVVPIESLDTPDAQQRLAAGVAGISVNPDGGTGLYDSVLAAVRQMRQVWDPQRFNSVLVLSDGQNDDRGSISLTDLTATLAAEQGDRPVPVIGIAFGPDSDVQALQQISAATGGQTYIARDPAQITQIFLEAVGHRIASEHR